MGVCVSKRTSFTVSSSSTTGNGGGGGGGVSLHFASWVAFDLGDWDLRWGNWFLRAFWSFFGVLQKQPILYEESLIFDGSDVVIIGR